MDSELQLDTDGWAGGANGDGTHRSGTSWNYVGGETPINANEVPYFVLPKNGWDAAHGISLGDYAAVIYKTKLVFAVFADRGEPFRIGEGSVKLLRLLGFNRILPNGRVDNRGTPKGVITIVFPGSRTRSVYPDQATLLADLNTKPRPLFESLRDTASPMPPMA
jgi:Fungal chitosanase of glycosyl hydrolase group 75